MSFAFLATGESLKLNTVGTSILRNHIFITISGLNDQYLGRCVTIARIIETSDCIEISIGKKANWNYCILDDFSA